MERFMIGYSCVIGNVICKPSILNEVSREEFFNEIDSSLKLNNLEKFKSLTLLKSNLRKGITIGSKFFTLEKIKSN